MIQPPRRRRPPPLASTVWAAVLGATAAAGTAQPQVSQADLLRQIIDLDRLTRPPPRGERSLVVHGRVFSDRRPPDAAPIDPARAGPEHESWDELAAVEGPGVIRRIAITAHPDSTDAPAEERRLPGRLRIASGGAVLLEAEVEQLFSGRLAPLAPPLVGGEWFSYFPIGFQDGCRILARGLLPSSRGLEERLRWEFDIHLTQFPPGTCVQPYTAQLDEAAQLALREVIATLQQGFTERSLLGARPAASVAVEQSIRPGQRLVESIPGAGTVRALYVGLTDRNVPPEPYALRRLVLRVYVDGRKTPAIEVPLIDFFGSAYERDPLRSLVSATQQRIPLPLPDRLPGEDTFLAAYWPMPFSDGMRIEIENLNEMRRAIGLVLHARIDPQAPAPHALRLCGRFERRPPGGPDLLRVLDAPGPGRLVGCVLSIDSLDGRWPDACGLRLRIDDRRADRQPLVSLRSVLGVGTDAPLAPGPLAGITRAGTGAGGKNAGFRWFIPDALAFERALAAELVPVGGASLGQTYCASVALWYGDPHASPPRNPLTVEEIEPPGLRIPGSIEVEDCIRGEGWGSIMKQKYAGGVELSGGAAAHVTTERPVKVEIASPTARRVRLDLRLHPRRSFETVEVRAVDGRVVGIVTYDRAADGRYAVGELELSAGSNTLQIRCPRPAVLDCWIVSAVGP